MNGIILLRYLKPDLKKLIKLKQGNKRWICNYKLQTYISFFIFFFEQKVRNTRVVFGPNYSAIEIVDQ
jgi:hypothetical protein